MKIVKQSILQAAHGAILEAADIELERISNYLSEELASLVEEGSVIIG